MNPNTIVCGDALKELRKLPDECVQCVITSPPYWGLRDYGVDGQIGSEETIEQFLKTMLLITWELRRVLRKDGVMFWDHGDNYAHHPSGLSGVGSTLNGGKKTQNMVAKLSTTKKYEYGIIPEKSLTLQAHRLAIRMVDEQQWILRNILIWHKPNAMPSSVKDRFGVDHEPIFFFSKSKKYHFEQQLEMSSEREWSKSFNMRVRDVARGKVASKQYKATAEEIQRHRKSQDPSIAAGGSGLKGHSGNNRADGSPIGVPGMRGMRTVWSVPTTPYEDAHFATFPEKLIERMVLAGAPPGGIVLDPFMGAGTTGLVAKKLGRQYLGIELNPEYVAMAERRIGKIPNPLF